MPCFGGGNFIVRRGKPYIGAEFCSHLLDSGVTCGIAGAIFKIWTAVLQVNNISKKRDLLKPLSVSLPMLAELDSSTIIKFNRHLLAASFNILKLFVNIDVLFL